MAKSNFVQAVGRRKTSSARVRLIDGIGENVVNGLPADQYFPGLLLGSTYTLPFETVESGSSFHMTAVVAGGGISSQAQAVAHGIARALSIKNPEWKPALRAANLITRDSRMKERRKAGNAHAARAKKSSPKR